MYGSPGCNIMYIFIPAYRTIPLVRPISVGQKRWPYKRDLLHCKLPFPTGGVATARREGHREAARDPVGRVHRQEVPHVGGGRLHCRDGHLPARPHQDTASVTRRSRRRGEESQAGRHQVPGNDEHGGGHRQGRGMFFLDCQKFGTSVGWRNSEAEY